MKPLSKKSLIKLQSIIKKHGVIVADEDAHKIGIRLVELTLLATSHRLREIFKEK